MHCASLLPCEAACSLGSASLEQKGGFSGRAAPRTGSCLGEGPSTFRVELGVPLPSRPTSSVPVSLTRLLRDPSVRAAWASQLPSTTDLVRSINRQRRPAIQVPPSEWTSQSQFGTVGTAYDYAIGTLWAGKDLTNAFNRVLRVAARFPRVLGLLAGLHELLAASAEAAPVDEVDRVERDFFRGLGLLAQLDAVFRAGVDPPPWTIELGERRVGIRGLRRHLRRHYPETFVDELIELLRVTRADLPRAAQATYNPVFGGPPGLEHVAADGDLIFGTTLMDLKVSTQAFGRKHAWQLLGYAALDRLHGRRRIARVALYNPRFRYLWTEKVEPFAEALGATSVEEFCAWFRDAPEAHSLGRRRAA